MPISDFSPEALDAEADRVRRDIEREYHLPEGACDTAKDDILRLMVWRDTGDDPGPLSRVQQQVYAAKYWGEIWIKKRAAGELIFKHESEAEGFLRDHSFVPVAGHPSRFEKGTISATILRSGLIVRVMAKNTLTGEILDNVRHLR